MSFLKESLWCPVCRVLLGTRDKNDTFMSHCDECKATFIWSPKAKKPTAQLDGKKSKVCKCSSCLSR